MRLIQFIKRCFSRRYIDLSEIKHLTDKGITPLFLYSNNIQEKERNKQLMDSSQSSLFLGKTSLIIQNDKIKEIS